jgi:predicted thioesterase
MQSELIIGAIGISSMEVRPGDTALAHGSGDVPTLSSSFLVTLMESAAITSIAEFLENGETTILAEIELKVHGAVPIGVEVQGAARCIELKDHTLTFDCEIHDGPRLVAAAIMRRTMVERVSFLARTAALSIISQQSQTN